MNPPQPPSSPSRKPRWPAYLVFGVLALVAIVSILISRPSDAKRAQDAAFDRCEEYVTAKLKAPASADFGDASLLDHGAGRYTVTGSVDAQNSFGAMIRNRYSCELQVDGNGTWTAVDVDVVGR